MRIQILGTAAAEGWPAVFCGCATCTRARAAGGHNIRSRASVQIDDIYKIDLPPDTYYHVIRYGLDLSRLAHLFVTHSHEDHFDLAELGYSRSPFAHNLANAPIRIYGNDTVTSAISTCFADKLPVEVVTLTPFQPVQAGSLVFTPIEARHNPAELCLNYVIESDAARVLYASDTGEYEQRTLDFLKTRKFDLIISECTQGTLPQPATYHMSFEAVVRLRDAVGGPSVRTIITHFSHNIGLLHDELEAIAGPEGVEVAYDGMTVEV